jgi:hypothetical protein
MGRPLLDVSDVLDDPDFQDTTLTVRRSVVTVGAHGRGEASEQSLPFAGVVIQNDSGSLVRAPEGQYVRGSLTIYTRFPLTSGNDTMDADVVQWNGLDFTVVNPIDWSSYGAGYIAAECQLVPLNATYANG